jgi:phosphoribosylanthranilate isomerase
MAKIKICGITNLEDALCACEAGADAIGFIFYKKSPRFISPQKAKEIASCLPERVLKVGVFVNETEKNIKNIARKCHLDLLQLHGDETADFCGKFKGYKVIKAFRVKDINSLKKIADYKVRAYLFDAYSAGRFGGTSRTFNWGLLKLLKGIGKPIFLSGGLNSRNVHKALKMVRPEWLDVSSSLESSPGKKSHKKIRSFIDAARKSRRS